MQLHYWDIQHVHSDNDLTFGWSGSEKVRIDSSGNLGIGVTPSDWGWVIDQAGQDVSIPFHAGRTDATSALNLGANTFVTATGGNAWKYFADGKASRYFTQTGEHYFQVAGTGTQGGTVTWTSALTIDNSANSTFAGNVDIYKTTDSQLQIESLNEDATITESSGSELLVAANREEGFIKFYQNNADFFTLGKKNNGQFVLTDHSAGQDVITFQDSGGILLTPANNLVDVTGSLTLRTNASFYSTRTYLGDAYTFGSTETADGVSYTINGAAAGTAGNYFRWLTQAGAATPVERMRIDSSGDIKFSSTQGTTLQFDRIDTTVIANEVIGKLDFKSTDSGDTGVNASIKVIKQDLAVGTVPMAITFETGVSGTIAERMRIDSSGLVSLTESLQIANTKNVQFIGSGGDHARITYTQGNGTTGDVWSHSFYQNSGFQASMEFFASTEAAGDGNIRFKTAATERMTITSGGDVLFGTQGTPNGTSVYHYKHILKIKHLAESILLQVIYGF